MVKVNCKSKRGTKVSVLLLGCVLFTVMAAYIVYGDYNDEMGLRNLRMISVIFRHGQRSPLYFYPNDPHASLEWPEGLGALNQQGILQLYNLGINLRVRYYRLLPSNGIYTQHQVHVLSSAAERCLMSAQSLLAGLMPPLDHNNVLPFPWQPVPIHSTPRLQDTIIAQTKCCSKYKNILAKLVGQPSTEMQKLIDDNSELFKLLSKHTGQNVSTILDIESLYNILKTEEDAGLVLPDWTENIYPDKLKPLAERCYLLFTETHLMKKVKGGPFLTEILNNMLDKRKKNLKPDRKIFLYSGHDISMVNIMNTLNIVEQTSNLPDYASALAFELHYSSLFKDDYEVKIVYYYNSDDRFPKDVRIPNCDAPCSLTQFQQSISSLLVESYDEACENTNETCNK